MTSDRKQFFEDKNYLIVDDFFNKKFLDDAQAIIKSIKFEDFRPPKLEGGYMSRLMNVKLIKKITYILLVSNKFGSLIKETF